MAYKTVLGNHIRSQIRRFRICLDNAHVPYEKLIVFGSHVKGFAKSWSDIDVCVVSKTFGINRHTERVALMNLLDDEILDIEPHPYSPSDLLNHWDPLAHEIRTYGIVVA